jgi:hypothetical protein
METNVTILDIRIMDKTEYTVIKVEGVRSNGELHEIEMPFEILADDKVIASTYTMNDAQEIINALKVLELSWNHIETFDEPEIEWESKNKFDIDVMRGKGKMVISKMKT